mmetsp:Transcript_73389/g.192424  ORF Transcript_73389/g.192424 Transcript_73389/m.192424 type:complete len:437 (+) Transcript_73389:711-2021(+)
MDRALRQPVHRHEVDEAGDLRRGREVLHVVPGGQVQDLQRSLHHGQAAVHEVEVVRAADDAWVRREGDVRRHRLGCLQVELVVLENPRHLAVVVPRGVTEEEVVVALRQPHEGRAAAVIDDALLPMRVVQGVLDRRVCRRLGRRRRSRAAPAALQEREGGALSHGVWRVGLHELRELAAGVQQHEVLQVQRVHPVALRSKVVAITHAPELHEHVTHVLQVRVRGLICQDVLLQVHLLFHVGELLPELIHDCLKRMGSRLVLAQQLFGVRVELRDAHASEQPLDEAGRVHPNVVGDQVGRSGLDVELRPAAGLDIVVEVPPGQPVHRLDAVVQPQSAVPLLEDHREAFAYPHLLDVQVHRDRVQRCVPSRCSGLARDLVLRLELHGVSPLVGGSDLGLRQGDALTQRGLSASGRGPPRRFDAAGQIEEGPHDKREAA